MCIIDTKSYDPENKDVSFEKSKIFSSNNMINSLGGVHMFVLTVMKHDVDDIPKIKFDENFELL